MKYLLDMKLHPAEWVGLLRYAATRELNLQRSMHADYDFSPTAEQVLIAEHARRTGETQTEAWYSRKPERQYNFRLKISLALALWSDMQRFPLSHDQQDFFSKLDERLKSAGLCRVPTTRLDVSEDDTQPCESGCSGPCGNFGISVYKGESETKRTRKNS